MGLDLETFLKRKKNRLREESASLQSLREYCPRCMRPRQICLCSSIVPFDTSVRIVILMHPKEAKKEKNGTGRLAHLHLKNSLMMVGVDFSQDERLKTMLEDPSIVAGVLYPGPGSLDVSQTDFSLLLQRKKRLLLFVIDGTWSTAKKMLKHNRNLNTLPRFHISPPVESRFTFKRQPHEACLSSAESIYYFLEEWQKQKMDDLESKHENLLRCFLEMVSFQIRCTESRKGEGYRRLKDERPERNLRRPTKNPFL